jgi:hypothetical protein
MPARRCLVVVGVAAAAFGGIGASVAAQEPRRIDMVYEVTAAGVTGVRVEVTARFDETRYDIESRAFKIGALRALTPRYEGHNRAWGLLVAGTAALAPVGGTLSIAASDQRRSWQVRYGADGAVEERHDPPWRPTPAQDIGDKDRQGALDPLTAVLSIGLAGEAACERTVPSFDGKRRIDVLLRKIGTEMPAQAGITQAKDGLLVCEARLRRVAGDFGEEPASTDGKERPVRVWLARLDSSPFRYPARLEVQGSLGLVRARLLSVSERPLAPQGTMR